MASIWDVFPARRLRGLFWDRMQQIATRTGAVGGGIDEVQKLGRGARFKGAASGRLGRLNVHVLALIEDRLAMLQLTIAQAVLHQRLLRSRGRGYRGKGLDRDWIRDCGLAMGVCKVLNLAVTGGTAGALGLLVRYKAGQRFGKAL